MCDTLIIGIGNPVRGDDALGWAAIEALKARDLPPDTHAVCVQQLTMDLVEEVAQAKRVIFIDARAAQPPGALQSERIRADSCLQAHSSHFFDPRALLAAAQALYEHHPEAWLFSINAASFEYGAPLSQAVQHALPEMLCAIHRTLRTRNASAATQRL